MVSEQAVPALQLVHSAARSSIAGTRCAVLGAGGFLGGALAARLSRDGAIVHAFGRSRSTHAPDHGMMWTDALFTDTLALARALEGQDVVFHLLSSSLPDTSNRDPAESVQTDIYNTVRFLDICKDSGVGKVIFASSGGTIYGAPTVVPTPEWAPTNPISAYGINKLTVEKYLALYHRLSDLNYLSFRIANPYGRGQSPLKKQGVISSIIHRALAGETIEIWGTGDVVRDFIHVEDVIEALVQGVSYGGEQRIMNVGSGHGRSINQLLLDIENALRLGRLRVLRKPGRAADVPVSILDTSVIARELEWRPAVDIQAGLSDTASWLRSAFHHA